MAKHDAPESPSDIRDLLAHLLAGAAGNTEAYWKKRLGEVTALPIVFHPRSNWQIEPTGKPEELRAIEKAVDLVRAAHPYVPSPRGSDIAP